jgi:hypothetical protein
MHLLRRATAAGLPGSAASARGRGVGVAASIVAGRRPVLLLKARTTATATTTATRALPQSASAGPPQPPVPGLAAQPWLGTPEQLAALDELRARFSSAAAPGGEEDGSSAGPPPPPADELLRWYLRDRYYSVDNAERKLRSMLEWRARYASAGDGAADGALWAPLGLPGVAGADVGAELATGKAYVHDGPDVAGRPVLVVVARKHAIGEREKEGQRERESTTAVAAPACFASRPPTRRPADPPTRPRPNPQPRAPTKQTNRRVPPRGQQAHVHAPPRRGRQPPPGHRRRPRPGRRAAPRRL